MHAIKIVLVAVCAGAICLATSLSASAQQSTAVRPEQPVKTYISAADVTALMSKAKRERKEGQSNLSQMLLHLPGYSVNLEYRASVGDAVIHETEAEVFYVVDGSATMILGGKLLNQSRLNATNLRGDSVDGGTAQKIGPGDFIIVPENTARWFSVIDKTLVVMSLHVPRTTNSAP